MADAPSTPINQAKQVLKQLGELWGKQPKGRRSLAVLILVGVIGFVAVTSFLKKTEQWSTVAEGMGPGNAQQLYTQLIGRGINARMKDGKLEVLDDDLGQARAIATVSGSLSTAKSFDEMFKGNDIGRSSFEEQIAYKMALEGELSHSVMSLVQPESARVSIAFGKPSSIKEMDSLPTASVSVLTRPGQQITTDQVKGIRALVAASVDRMKPEAVVVIGPRGPLDGDDEAPNRQVDVEAKVSNTTRKLLETIVGVGHVNVVATADVDTSKISQTEELFDKDSAAIRSESRTLHGSDPSNGTQSSVGGIAGARGNLPGAPAPSAGSGAPAAGTTPGNGDLQETKNYEISKKVVQTVKPEQTIKKLHVAIIVDETKDKKGVSIPRTKEELERMMALARNTAGIDDARGDTIELRSVPFAPVAEPEVPAVPKPLLPVPLPVAAGGAGGVLVLLILAVMMLKRKKNKKANRSQQLVLKSGKLPYPTPVHEFERQVIEAELDPASKAAVAAALAKSEAPGLPAGKTAQERVMDVVRADVDRAAGVLTAWLAETPPAAAAAAAKGASK